MSRPTAKPRSLLETVQGWIEQTYRLQTGIRRVDLFIVGDRGFRERYRDAAIVRSVDTGADSEAKVLVREECGHLRASLYYPDSLIAHLEAHNPLQGLDEGNIDAFGVFVEELDHLLTLADRAGKQRPVSLFELELHANVTKYYAAKQIVVRMSGRALGEGERCWLRYQLFEKVDFDACGPAELGRYRDASRYALGYLAQLEALPGRERLEELRRFHDAPSRRAMSRRTGNA